MPAAPAALSFTRFYYRSQTNDMRSTCPRLYLVAAAVVAFGPTAAAIADDQFSASATLESQYRLRGVALTNDEPDARIEVSYDHSSGAYVGISLIGGKTVHDEFRGLGFVGYLGFAQATASGISWDLGATISEINIYLRPLYSPPRPAPYATQTPVYPGSQPGTVSDVIHYRADYSEVYGGISWRDTSVYLYASPDYLGQDLRTVYLDVTQSFRPIQHLRLYAHAGVLTALDGSALPGDDREHYDLGAGAAYEFHRGEVRVAWSGISPQVQYPAGYPQKHSVILVSVTGFF
jgi:hypothetical protein